MFQCERISIDQFERGPVYFLLEGHNDITAPSKCQEGGFDQPPRLVHEFWISDADVAGHLHAKYGLPAAYAELGLSNMTNGPLTEDTWTFHLPSSDQSTLVARKMAPDNQNELPVFRYFWVNQASGISYFDFEGDYHSSNADPHTVTGTINSPFIPASPAPYAGYGGPLANGHISAPITQFRDLKCEQPL